MKWSNLKQNNCPKCDKDLMRGVEQQITRNGDKILLHPCGFKIRENRMMQIVSSQITTGLEEKLDKEYGEE